MTKWHLLVVSVAFMFIGLPMIVLGADPLPRIFGYVIVCSGALSLGILLAKWADRAGEKRMKRRMHSTPPRWRDDG